MKIKGKLKPLKDKIFVSDMHFGEDVTSSGLILLDDNGTGNGIYPRWCKVWAIGPDQKDVNVGEWLLVEHARWTRTISYETAAGEIIELRVIDNNAILLVSDEKPEGVVQRSLAAINAGGKFNFNVPSA